MRIALLALTVALILTSAALFVVGFRSRGSSAALHGMTAMLVAAIPALVYGSLSS